MSWQKDIGTRFEHQIKERFNALKKDTALTAVRIWYSGAGAREPFDVGIYRGEVRQENLVLEIEAKRTQKRSIGLKLEWLEKVSKRHVIVLAVGRRNPVPMYVVRDCGSGLGVGAGTIIKAKPGSKSLAIHQRWVQRPMLGQFLLLAKERWFIVEDFELFVEREFGKPREVSDGHA